MKKLIKREVYKVPHVRKVYLETYRDGFHRDIKVVLETSQSVKGSVPMKIMHKIHMVLKQHRKDFPYIRYPHLVVRVLEAQYELYEQLLEDWREVHGCKASISLEVYDD